jgi:hypothetical protein
MLHRQILWIQQLSCANQKARLPLDEAGSSFWQSGAQMLGLAALLARTPVPRKPAPAENVTFSMWIVRRIYTRSIFFAEEGLFVWLSQWRPIRRKNRSIGRKTKN